MKKRKKKDAKRKKKNRDESSFFRDLSKLYFLHFDITRWAFKYIVNILGY